MGKLAFVFPGQGSQVVGMGRALAEAFPEAKAVFDAVDAALGESLSGLCFDGPEAALKLTANTQPAILTVSLAAHAVVVSRGLKADVVAGHSLGEYSALVAAGALSLEDAVVAVRARGRFMQEAVPEGVGAMAAVLGLEATKLVAICKELSVDGNVVSVANFNSPEQTVIAGHAKAVEQASAALLAAGAKRVLPLPVSAPFHCGLMDPVKPRLEAVLRPLQIRPLSLPLIANVTAEPNRDEKQVVRLLIEQVSAPVRWVETVQSLEKQGVTTLVELGPGKVLTGLAKRMSKGITLLNVEDPQSLEKTLAALTPERVSA